MDRQPYFTSEGAAGFTTVGFCVWPEEKQEKKRVEVRTSSLYKIFFSPSPSNVCPHSEKKGLKEAENEGKKLWTEAAAKFKAISLLKGFIFFLDSETLSIALKKCRVLTFPNSASYFFILFAPFSLSYCGLPKLLAEKLFSFRSKNTLLSVMKSNKAAPDRGLPLLCTPTIWQKGFLQRTKKFPSSCGNTSSV